MKKALLRFLVIIGAVLVAIVACDNPAGSDDSGPDVDGVDAASLSADVSSDDLGTVGGGTAPTDKFEVLDSIGLGLEVVGINVEDFLDYNYDWEPVTGTLTIDPEDLFELEEAPDGPISISGSLEDESMDFTQSFYDNDGTATISGTFNVTATVPWNETVDSPSSVTVTSSLDEVVAEVVDVTNEYETVFVPAGKLALAVNANLEAIPTYDAEGYVTRMEGAYAISAILRLAITVDSSDSEDTTGNYILRVELGDAEDIVITEAMMEDDDVLGDYLDERIVPDVLEITVDVYDSAGTTVVDTYTYSKQDLIDYFESFEE